MPDVDHVQTDSFAATETPGGVTPFASTDKTSSDRFRFSELESVQDTAVIPLLARPTYALVEPHHRTATIIDYSETIEDADWRETGIDVDI